MIPRGASSRIFASGTLNGWISEYTFCSRTRRAISCVYCPPKSRIRIRSRLLLDTTLLLDTVVGRLFGDDDVVNVRLAQAHGGGADELRLGAQVVDGAAPRVAHAGLQPADELVDRL